MLRNLGSSILHNYMFIAGVKVQKVLQIKAICHKSDILAFIFFY